MSEGGTDRPSTPLMQIGWVFSLMGIGATLFSRLPPRVAAWTGIAISIIGIAAVCVGGRLRDGAWLSTEVDRDV